MQKLEKVHEDLHRTVRHIISLKRSGDSTGAELEYKKIGPSDEIVSLLTIIETKVRDME